MSSPSSTSRVAPPQRASPAAAPIAETRVQPQVAVVDLRVGYGDVTALNGIDLTVPFGEQVAIVGPSGCGKSTLVKAMAGLVPVDNGRIDVAGRVVSAVGTWVPPEHRSVGVVFQDHALFPHLDVRANVGFGLGSMSDATPRIAEVLALVGLGDLADRFPHELSGGEQQRVALARALAPRPAVVLFDEPFSNLDRNLRERIRRDTVALLRAERVTAVFVTHDRDEALTVGSRVAVMRDGRVEQFDTPSQVYHQPASRFVARFLDHADFLSGTLVHDGAATELGVVAIRRDSVGDARPGTMIDVMVRPHDVDVLDDPTGTGVVVATEFRGGAVAHVVALTDGSTVTGLRPHTAPLDVGTRVQVRICHDHPLTAFPG